MLIRFYSFLIAYGGEKNLINTDQYQVEEVDITIHPNYYFSIFIPLKLISIFLIALIIFLILLPQAVGFNLPLKLALLTIKNGLKSKVAI